jgi:two-component system osmolarity sensor histidine kinase EnvZ
MTVGVFVKRFLPRSLLGRSLMIIVTPLIVLQLVSAWVFYDRHWETISRRLVSAVAGEIAVAIEGLRQFPGEEDQSRILATTALPGLGMRYVKGGILPNEPPERRGGILERLLDRALNDALRRPYQLDVWSYDRDVRIQVQLHDGVLDILVPRERLFSSTTYIFVMWMVGTAMVLFAVATVFMRNQVRPISRLAAAVDSFGKGRDAPDFKPEGSTEIRLAAQAFGRMRQRILRTISQRTDMLAGVSHDLRTPLTRMKLQLAMMAPTPEIADLKADVAEMEKLVDEYLSFARGESTEAVVTADVADLLDDVVSGARRNGATIALQAEPGLKVPLRPNAFKRSITNIVSNAQRHARRIEIRAARHRDAIEIVVDDDGPGIPAGEREEVFKPFYRREGSRNQETGGIGLGLSIARDILRGHGGDITLEDAPQGGVRARVKLPI